MSNKKVLIIGASHTAAVMNLVRRGFSVPGIDFEMYGIHGPAYTSDALFSLEQNMLTLASVHAEGHEHHWFSNAPVNRPLDLKECVAIFLLEPLFIIGGFMRWQLWAGGKGICLEFLSKEYVCDYASLPRHFRPISSSEWLSIYTGWRKGTMKLFDSIRQLRSDIPILVLPPAAPPKRLATGIYPRYNRQEQAFLGEYLRQRFNAQFILQPDLTMDSEFQTLDEFHEPAPDPHHANAAYYKFIFDLVNFETFSFKSYSS